MIWLRLPGVAWVGSQHTIDKIHGQKGYITLACSQNPPLLNVRGLPNGTIQYTISHAETYAARSDLRQQGVQESVAS